MKKTLIFLLILLFNGIAIAKINTQPQKPLPIADQILKEDNKNTTTGKNNSTKNQLINIDYDSVAESIYIQVKDKITFINKKLTKEEQKKIIKDYMKNMVIDELADLFTNIEYIYIKKNIEITSCEKPTFISIQQIKNQVAICFNKTKHNIVTAKYLVKTKNKYETPLIFEFKKTEKGHVLSSILIKDINTQEF